MRRRTLLTAIGFVGAGISGCVSPDQVVEEGGSEGVNGGEPTVHPASTPSEPEAREILDFGEWATVSGSAISDFGLRVDGAGFQRRFEASNSNIRDLILPEGKTAALVTFTVKNISQSKIRRPGLDYLSIIHGEKRYSVTDTLDRSRNCDDGTCEQRPHIENFRNPLSVPHGPIEHYSTPGGNTPESALPSGETIQFWRAFIVPEGLEEDQFYVSYHVPWRLDGIWWKR